MVLKKMVFPLHDMKLLIYIIFCASCSNVYERLVHSQWSSLHCIHSKPHMHCNGTELSLDTLIPARHSLV